ncbi:MAG: hypothetical protein M1378_02110 [Bacteroidetes bacterium]|nr:hypothetical protein [Bacteroidota bacterium]
MAKKKVASDLIPEYSPEFKLRVVLQYLQNPKEAERICNENQIRYELLELWHQEFIARAGLIFGGAFAVTRSQTSASSRTGETTNQEQQSQVPSWGVRINYEKCGSLKSASSSNELPAWLGPVERKGWQTKRSVLIWDNETQKLEVLSAKRALELLNKFGKTNQWQTEGIPITQVLATSPLPLPPDSQSSKKSKRKAASTNSASTAEPVEVERMHLPPSTAPEFLAFLLEHESLLKTMAEEDAKEQEQYWMTILDLLMIGARESNAKSVDISARPLKWVHEDLSDKWICDLPPNRGTVELDQRGWCWQSCIEQPNEFKRYSNLFLRLDEAMTWTEQELTAIQKASEVAPVPAKSESGTRAKPRMDLTPYRIDPAALEPERTTYLVVIELEHVPDSFKTREMSFGKLYRYNETFPTPTRISGELELAPTQVHIDEQYGISNGGYRIWSTATFEQATVAEESARNLWSASGIHQLYKTDKITRARFGVEEIETSFCRWLGQLEDTKHPWPKQETRTQHLAGWAMLETLAFTLDVDGFRERFGISKDTMDDEYLLGLLHQRRVASKFIPASAREESKQWLKDYRRKKKTAD